jgi:cell division protein FtsB
MRIKKAFMRLLLMAEMTALGYLYFFSTNGIEALQKQRAVVTHLEKNVVELKKEIEHLEQEMHAWQTDDFYKEKIAREQLQMARKGDELFYIGT